MKIMVMRLMMLMMTKPYDYDNDMVDGIEADLEIDTGELMQFIFPTAGDDFELRDGFSE